MTTNFDDVFANDGYGTDSPADDFDAVFGNAEYKPQKQNTGLLGDIGTDLKRGALKLPGAVTGLADIPVGIVTGERKVSQWADSVGEATGFQPGKWADEAAKEYSPKRQAGAEEIDTAWEEGGAADIAGAYLRNPGNIAGLVAESLPSMVAGGLAGRAAMGVAGLAGRSLSPVVAGAAGEAAVSAGQAMEQISDDVDARRAATAAAATGALSGALGYAGGRAAQRLGLVDPEAAIAGGVAATATDRPPRGLASRMLAGAMSEGAFEELPQSVQEQMWQNWAEGRDLSEGVARSAVEGTISGGAMGAAANVMPAGRSPQPDGGPSLTIEPEFGIDPDQRALPPPVSTGTPNEQVLQAEVERANEVAAAEARTAELYRQRSEVEAQRAGIDPQGGPLQKAAATALDRRAADLDAASQPTDVEGPQRQPPVRERDYVPPPSGSFSTMDDLAELVGQERQDVDQRRAAIAETQAQRRDFEFEEADRRVAQQMQREAATRRRMVLDAVLEDPETANHAERFAATLKRFGFRDAMPTEDELATIRRFENVRAAQPAAPEVEPAAPNELDAGALGIRERQARPSQPAGGAQSGAGGDSPAAATGTTVATRPPVRFASPEAEQRAGRALPVASEGGARKKADEITKRRGELFVAIPHTTRTGRFAVVPSSTLAPPAADISGQQINRRWTSFSTDSGTLAIPRSQMPQIQAEHRGAMVNFLSARGVQSTQEELSPESLKPTQAEFSPEKVRRAMGRRQGNRSILVSSDGYVLDGHHQWLAAREEGLSIKAIRLDAPIRDLIDLAREFPSSTTERGAAGAPAANPAQGVVEVSPVKGGAAPTTTPAVERRLDHGELNIPGRTRGIDAELDRYKRDQARAEKAQAKAGAQQRKDDKTEARRLFAEVGPVMRETLGPKLGDKELRDHLDQMVKWEPRKFIALANKFQAEQRAAADREARAQQDGTAIRETERGTALFSRTTTASRAGMTADALRQSFAARMPALSRAVDAMLRRGDAGKKGGAVVIDAADETEIARAFASKTGRKFDEVVQYFRSEDTGDIQGFYDPRSGITFLVGPNLTAESAPAVLLHEMTHSQQRADIDAKAMRLLADRDFMPMRRELLQFLDRVAARMDDAGETGNAREATAYIVEEAVLRGRNAGFSAVDGRFMNWVDSTLGKRAGAIIRDFVAMVRAWALRHGGMLRNPSVDDLVAVAVAGAKRAARGDVVTSGGTTMASTAAEALQAKTATPEFKEWFGTSKMVGKDGSPLVFLHGSPNAFEAFDNGKLGGASQHTSAGLGHFFTRSRDVAEKYADGGHIYRGWLRMQKPYVMNLAEAQGFDDKGSAEARRKALQKEGYDGAIILDDTRKPWAFVVFEPWQFKSTDNRGTFDEFDDRFRFSRADGVRVAGVEELHRILVGDPVATLRTDEAPHQGKAKLREWAVGIFRGYGFYANNPKIGRVLMDERSVRDSLGHSLNPFKAVAFKAVPDVIEKGAIAHIERKGKVDSIYISAPVVINGADDVVTVLVHRDVNSQRMYLHSVTTKESLLRSSQSSADAEASGRSGTVISGGISKILREALNYKDIRFSRTGAAYGSPPRSRNPSSITAAWDAPEPSKLDNLLYTLQNKQIDMKRVVDAVKEKIGQIEDAWNPYLQEELFHGRSAKGVKDFLTHEMRPLLIEMRMANVSMADFERFLHARHAPEANAHIAKINPNEPDLQDGGSGMTNKEAADHLASLDPARRKTLERLAKRIDAINANTRKLLVDSGLETAETVKAWEAAYKHYVPLQREDAEAGGLGIGQGFSVRGSAAKRRTGSKKAVVDILANIAMQRERTITRAEKNRVAQANYALALKAPNPDFWMPVNPDEAKAWAPAQRQKIADELTRMGLDPADAQNFVKEPVQRYVDPRTGLVSERINPVLRSADSVLAVRIDGKDRFVFFNRGDERAQRMVHALKNLDADQLGRVLQVSAKLTRWFAAVNTQYNPVFGVVNLTRDVQAALLQLSTTPIRGAEKAVLRNTMPAMRGIYAALRAERDGKAAPTDQWAQLFEEFQNEGGQTGYRDQFSSSQARADALQKELDPEGWMDSPLGKVFTANGALKVPMAQAQKMAGGLFGWLSDYNDTLENSVRLAAYKAAKDRGMTRQQAASVAKNLTVNFNRKGQIATQAGAMYAFFNAAMQGTTRMVQTLRGPAGKKIIAGGLSLGVLQALTLAAAGFDDDDPPEFVRERSIVIPIGGGKYVSIPMPLGFHVIPSTSRIMTEWALSGFKDTPRRFGDFMALFADTFNPIGNAGWSMQTLAPTALDPLAALAENRDWTGKPIAQEDFNSLRPSPGHARAKDTASELSKALSYWFNLASGGTDYKPGLISPTPDQIDYLIGQVTGGVGREYLKAEQTAMSVLTGEELPPHKIPLLGRFYGDTTGQSSESARFYNNLREINLHRAEVEGRRRDHGDVAGYLQDNPSARLALGGPVAVENHVRKLRKAKEQAVEAGQTARVKMIDSQITALMRGFNERVAALDG